MTHDPDLWPPDRRWTPKFVERGPNRILTTVTQPTDPAFRLLHDDYTTTPIFAREDCYICMDPEFAQMGLPLCYRCPACRGHVPADDAVCTDCGYDNYKGEL